VSGHLCRCGVYPNIFKAVTAAGEVIERSRAEGGNAP
jgi:aerobic-type carbon monoxide dehydrogenase small subunit (CoxS/CutS family)